MSQQQHDHENGTPNDESLRLAWNEEEELAYLQSFAEDSILLRPEGGIEAHRYDPDVGLLLQDSSDDVPSAQRDEDQDGEISRSIPKDYHSAEHSALEQASSTSRLRMSVLSDLNDVSEAHREEARLATNRPTKSTTSEVMEMSEDDYIQTMRRKTNRTSVPNEDWKLVEAQQAENVNTMPGQERSAADSGPERPDQHSGESMQSLKPAKKKRRNQKPTNPGSERRRLPRPEPYVPDPSLSAEQNKHRKLIRKKRFCYEQEDTLDKVSGKEAEREKRLWRDKIRRVDRALENLHKAHPHLTSEQ